MKQYTNAYRRIPVYAYQFMAGPAALEAPVAGGGDGGRVRGLRIRVDRPGDVGELRCGGRAFEGDVVQR